MGTNLICSNTTSSVMYFVFFISCRLLRRGAGLRGEKISAGVKDLFSYLRMYRSANLRVLSSFALNLMLLSDIAVVAGKGCKS
jgi:hypothetical protein